MLCLKLGAARQRVARPLTPPRLRKRDTQPPLKRLLLFDLVHNGLEHPLQAYYLCTYLGNHAEVEGPVSLLLIVAALSLLQHLAPHSSARAPGSGCEAHEDQLCGQANPSVKNRW